MKKFSSLALALMLVLSGCSSAPNNDTAKFKAGSYTGSAKGNNGDVVVEVTLTQDKIESISVKQHEETAGLGDTAIERVIDEIIKTQSVQVETVSGATNSSNATIEAVSAALKEAGVDVNTLTPQSSNEEKVAVEDTSADIVVIGGGGAGLTAAIEAADAGAKNIILLEKMMQTGGTTATAQGMIAGYETQVQKAAGDEAISYEAMYDNLMNNALWKLEPELTEITVRNCGKTIDWLMDRANVKFQDEVLVGYGPLKMMHVVDGLGVSLIEELTRTASEAGVDIRTENKAVELILDDNNNIAGVKVETNGQTYTINTKAVVLATGGYAYNPELTALLDPEKEGTFGIGHPSNTGDGLIMASNVGAALTHTNHLMAVLKDYEIMKDHNGTSNSANISRFIAQDNLVLVGVDGKRFVDEKSGGYMTQLLNEPIFDQMHKQGSEFVWAISDVASLEAAEVKRGADLEFISANTVEELAEKMEVDVNALTETLASYNKYASEGYDPEFKRTTFAPLTAPYVAVKAVPCEIITYGGVARNESAEVLRADASVIGGLYAAGEVSANSAYMGFTLSNAVTWGRIAGANAASYISE